MGKTTLASLLTAHFVALRPPLPFRQARFAQAFLLKPAPLCKLSAGLGSTNKSVTSLVISFSRLASLSSIRLSFYLKLYEISLRNCLLSPPVLSGSSVSPDTRFSRGTTRLVRWPGGVRYFCCLQSLAVSLLLFLISTVVFYWIGGANFFFKQVPSVSTEEFVLPRHARCVLSHVFSNGHSLLFNTFLSRIGNIEHSALSSYRLFAPLAI